MEGGRPVRDPGLPHVWMCQAEVEHPDLVPRRDHHVARLQVEMKHAVLVCMGHGTAERTQYAQRVGARQLAGAQAIEEAAQQLAVDQFHRDEVRVSVAVEVEDLDEPGMGERLRLQELAPQGRDRLGSPRELVAQHLECHVTMLVGEVETVAVQCPVDGAHPTRAEPVFEDVALAQHAAGTDRRPLRRALYPDGGAGRCQWRASARRRRCFPLRLHGFRQEPGDRHDSGRGQQDRCRRRVCYGQQLGRSTRLRSVPQPSLVRNRRSFTTRDVFQPGTEDFQVAQLQAAILVVASQEQQGLAGRSRVVPAKRGQGAVERRRTAAALDVGIHPALELVGAEGRGRFEG